MVDKMTIEILDDGTISVKTSSISQKNHISADEFLSLVQDMAGGEVTTKKAKSSPSMALRSKDRRLDTFQK